MQVDVYITYQDTLFLVTATLYPNTGEIDKYRIFLPTDQDQDLYPFLSSSAIEHITSLADEKIFKDYTHG